MSSLNTGDFAQLCRYAGETALRVQIIHTYKSVYGISHTIKLLEAGRYYGQDFGRGALLEGDIYSASDCYQVNLIPAV